MSQDNALQRAWLAYAYAAAGKRLEAQELLNPLLKMAAQDYFPPYFIAMVYIGLGEKDRAFEWIEKEFVERSAGMARLKIDPVSIRCVRILALPVRLASVRWKCVRILFQSAERTSA